MLDNFIFSTLLTVSERNANLTWLLKEIRYTSCQPVSLQLTSIIELKGSKNVSFKYDEASDNSKIVNYCLVIDVEWFGRFQVELCSNISLTNDQVEINTSIFKITLSSK